MESASPTSNGAQAPEAPKESSLEQRVQELEAQLKDKDAKYVYLYAEFENFKKRVTKERQDLLKFGWENQARDLLLVVDNLERALAHTPATTDANLLAGLKMVLQQFEQTIGRFGVQVIATQGAAFDPNFHEAVGSEASDLPEGSVCREELRGYTLHGRLLRPARVVLSAGKIAQA